MGIHLGLSLLVWRAARTRGASAFFSFLGRSFTEESPVRSRTRYPNVLPVLPFLRAPFLRLSRSLATFALLPILYRPSIPSLLQRAP